MIGPPEEADNVARDFVVNLENKSPTKTGDIDDEVQKKLEEIQPNYGKLMAEHNLPPLGIVLGLSASQSPICTPLTFMMSEQTVSKMKTPLFLNHFNKRGQSPS